MAIQVRILVPKKLSVIGLIYLGLNGFAGMFANVVKLNDVEEAVCIRMRPKLGNDK